MADDNAGYSDAFWRDAERKLPEPTPPTETQAIKVTRRSLSDPDEVAALLGEIHKDVQDQIHDQWDWMNASFYTECLRCMVHRAREVAAPTERVDDVIARMIQEVAPAPLCVSTETVKQLRPLLEELAQRRATERVETSHPTFEELSKGFENLFKLAEAIELADIRSERQDDWNLRQYRVESRPSAILGLRDIIRAQAAAVAPSPAGESQEASK